MAILPIPKFHVFKTLDSSPTDEKIAGFTPSSTIELAHIVLTLQRVGTEGGSETFTLKVHDTSAYNNVIDTSNTITYSAIKESNNYHRLRFDFNRKILAAGSTYYLEIESANYTRNGDTFYFAVVNESDSAFNSQGSAAANASCAAAAWYGYK